MKFGRIVTSTRWSASRGKYVTCWYGAELDGDILRHPAEDGESVVEIFLNDRPDLRGRLEVRNGDLYIRPEWAGAGHCGEPLF